MRNSLFRIHQDIRIENTNAGKGYIIEIHESHATACFLGCPPLRLPDYFLVKKGSYFFS